MRNMMEAADTMQTTNAAETGVHGTGTVEAGMHAVSAAVTTTMSAAVTTTMSAAVTTAMSAAMSAAMPAATPASGRDGRGESRRNERAGDGGGDGHCSKHGPVSSWPSTRGNANAGG
jgi:hypothetical protein